MSSLSAQRWVSFLCPSRGRPESLRRSIESLRSTAYDPECFEVLVYIDDDDPAGDAYFDGFSDLGAYVFEGPALGYSRLHECIANRLVPYARGQWLWLWNDDAVMQTERWDVKLRKYPVNIIGNPDTNHGSHVTGLNVFPVIPRAWVDLVGWARDGANDTWWQFIGQALGVQRNLPVQVLHDRSDLTGGHDDATRAGNNYDPSGFWSEATQAEIRADAEKIAAVFG